MVMKIVRAKEGLNNFVWEGLTLGKLLALRNALESTTMADRGAVKEDLLLFLQRLNLDEIKP